MALGGVKIRRTQKRKSKFEQNLEMQHAWGPEPIFPDEQDRIGTVLNWYNYMATDKEKKKWLLEYLDDEVDAKLKALPERLFRTTGAVARIIQRGGVFSERSLKAFENRVNELKAFEMLEKLATVNENRPLSRIKDYVIVIDNEIDKFLENGCKTTFDFAQYISQNKLPGTTREDLIHWYENDLQELNGYVQGKDKALLESYQYLGQRKAKRYMNILQNIVTACKKDTRPATKRGPRVKKAKSPEQLVKNLKICKHDADLDLKSVNPEKIIEAKQLIVWNKKYRKLIVYSSKQGLTVSGTSVKDYDSSLSKTVRKPEEFFKKFTSKTPKQQKKLWDGINGKSFETSGRLGDDAVLLSIM